MSNQKFAVSDDFRMFEAKAGTALQEAREAEKNARGCDLPTGTEGDMIVTGLRTQKMKGKKGTGGAPDNPDYLAIVMEFQVTSPEQYKGRAQSRMFNLDDHPNMSSVQKYQQWCDFCEDCGLPHDVRVKSDTAGIFNWFATEPRATRFVVEENKGYRNIKAVGKSEQVIPTPTAINSALTSSFATNDVVVFAGKSWVYVGPSSPGKCKIRSQTTGQEVEVDENTLIRA